MVSFVGGGFLIGLAAACGLFFMCFNPVFVDGLQNVPSWRFMELVIAVIT